MKDLKVRVLIAAIALPLLVFYILKLPEGWVVGLLALVAAIALHEFYTMYKVPDAMKYMGIALGIFMMLATLRGIAGASLAGAVIVLLALRLFTKPEPSGAGADIAIVGLGWLYIPMLMVFQVALWKIRPALLLYLYGMIWISDAAAYFIGSKYGANGPKLYPSISPNKSWAGTWGSVGGGLAGALLLNLALGLKLQVNAAVAVGLVIGALAVVGDLVESMFKRDAGVKDSGTLFPGHGGVLDKIDGSLYLGPVLLWSLEWLGAIKSVLGYRVN